jgi:hypothetical protein
MTDEYRVRSFYPKARVVKTKTGDFYVKASSYDERRLSLYSIGQDEAWADARKRQHL